MFVICRDNILRCIASNLYERGRLARWQAAIAEFDLVYLAQQSVKGQVLTDHMAAHPCRDDACIDVTTPDDTINQVVGDRPIASLAFDGAATQQGSSAAGIITFPDGVF